MAVAHPRVAHAIAVADMRWSQRLPTGGYAPLGDSGGKLFRFGSGWLVGASTSADLYLEVPWRVAVARVDCCDHQVMCEGITALGRTAPHVGATFYAASASKRSVHLYNTNGASQVLDERGGAFVDWPYVCSPDTDPGVLAFRTNLRTAVHAPLPDYAVLRCVLAEFARASEVSDLMSPTVEVGYGEKYLRGNAADLSGATDEDLRACLSDPPDNVLPAAAMAFVQSMRSRLIELSARGE